MNAPDYSRDRKYQFDAAAPGFYALNYCPLVPGQSTVDAVIREPILYWAICTDAHASEAYMIGSICALNYYSYGPSDQHRTILGPHGGVEDSDNHFATIGEWLAEQAAKDLV